MENHSRKHFITLCVPFSTVFLVWFSLVSTVSAAQTKPAAAKPKTSKTQPAKQSTSSGTAQKPSTRPAAKTPVKSGQSVTTKPAPAKSQTQSTQSQAAVPTKTATAPANDYKAKTSTAATPPRKARKQASYGLAYNKGDNLLNVGIGLTSYYYGTPIGTSFEWGAHEDISFGVQLDYNSGHYDNYYYRSDRWGYRAYYLGARASYHFNRLLKIRTSKIDLYAGAGLGYQSFRWNNGSYGYGYNYNSGLFLNGFVGAKYYFTPRVSAFTELGRTGLSYSRVGVAFKF